MKNKPSKREAIEITRKLSEFLDKRLSKKLVSVLLFGSVVREEAKIGSDIDVLVVLDLALPEKSEGLDIFFDATIDFEDTYLADVDWYIQYVPFTKEEASVTHPFYLDMIENSVITFDRGKFMKRKLKTLKKRMNELGTRKVFLPGGKWYWQLKPGAEPGEEIEL